MITILTGDCREVLKRLAERSVQCVMTSPPYFGLRSYLPDGHPDKALEMGSEETPEKFVAELVAVFREVRRVLRDDGTCWINIGDSYASTSGSSGASLKSTLQTKPTAAKTAAQREIGSWKRGIGDAKPKDLIGIPWRLAFALQADGWVLRQEIIWAKPNPMPESVTDRCTKSHEQIFLLTKAGWSGPEAGRFGHIPDEDARWLALCVDTEGCIVIKRVKHEGRGDTFAPQVSFGSTSRALMDRFMSIVGHGSLGQRAGKNAPMWYWQAANGIAADFLKCIYPHLIIKQRQARIGIHVDAQTYYRGGKTAERKKRSDAETNALLSLWARNKALNHFGDPDISDVPEPRFGRWTAGARYFYDAAAVAEPALQPTGDPLEASGRGSNHKQRAIGQNKGGYLGANSGSTTRNRRSVWTIATQPYSGAHFATMPPELAETCIKAGSRPGGMILDPFGGAGTTGLVADRLGRHATLIELNPAYAEALRARIKGDAGLFYTEAAE